ncbi:MAG: hypothetical protein COB08_010840 [Rhodobacteraceae bacterium]|nr:hypothetical protein [Paracoccaceae bacterium]
MLNKILCASAKRPSRLRGLSGAKYLLVAVLVGCFGGAKAGAQSINLSGNFTPGTAEAFQQALTRDIDTVLLDVSGGYLSEGLAIGRIIRSRNLRVVIPQGAVCYSACAEAFLGGTRKQIIGVLAFHVPRVEGARSKRQAFRFGLTGGTATAIYRHEMGYGFELTRDINRWTNENTMLAFRNVEELEGYRNANRASALPTLIRYHP